MEFLTAHVEKIVLAVAGMIAGYFLYSAMTVPRYERTPQDFQDTISRASTTVTKSEPKVDDLPPLEFDTELAKLKEPIKRDQYSLASPFYRPMELSYQFRGRPEVLKAGRPMVQVNRGLLLQKDKPAKEKGQLRVFKDLLARGYPAELIWYLGNEEMAELTGVLPKKTEERSQPARAEPRRNRPANRPADEDETDSDRGDRRTARGAVWVEVVAPFPHADQLREFVAKLKEGVDLVGVRYALTQAERRELNESLEWTEWKRIPWDQQFDLFELAEELDDPAKALPEGVVVNGLAMRVPVRAQLGADQDAPEIQTVPSLIPDEFLNAQEPEWTPAELDPRAEGKAEPAVKRADRLNEEEQAIEDAKRREGGRRAGGGGSFDNFSDVETAMMRVYDFSAEPGRCYQYRVRAVLFNPNYNRPDVADPDEALSVFLESDSSWSEESAEIYVEPDTNYLLADNTSARSGRAKFSIYHWIATAGQWVRAEVDAQAGQVIGSGSANKPVRVPSYNVQDRQLSFKSQPLGKEIDTASVLLEVPDDSIRDKLGEREIQFRIPRDVVVMNHFGDLIRHREVDELANPDRVERDQSIQRMEEDPSGKGGRVRAIDDDEENGDEDLPDPTRDP
jgi:hypothetical protein